MKGLNIYVIGFDWDGTLVDSMSIKPQSFAQAVIEFYPALIDKRNELEKLYLAKRGNPRTYQLGLVQKKYNLVALSNEGICRWSNLFTSLYKDKKPSLFDDTIRTLEELKSRKYKLFLSSSVPQDELEEMLTSYTLEGYFNIVLGARKKTRFRKGVSHLTCVANYYEVPLRRLAFVGDGPTDVKMANKAGCFSVRKIDQRSPNSKTEIQKNNPKLVIKNLSELLTYFN